MVQFGKQYFLISSLSFWGKVGYWIYGHPHIAKYLQSHQFKKNMQKIISRQTKRVLDVGCGSGDYAFYLAEKYPWLEIDAIDNDPFNIRTARELQEKKNNENITFICSEGSSYRSDKEYDVMYCVEMLHAVNNKEKFLKKIMTFLKINGYFYFQDCLKGGYYAPIFSSQPVPFREYQKKFFVGEQITLRVLIEYLRTSHFNIVNIQHFVGFFGQLAWEVDQKLHQYSRMRTFFIPFIKLLCWFDFINPVGKKNEVSIIARRQQ